MDMVLAFPPSFSRARCFLQLELVASPEAYPQMLALAGGDTEITLDSLKLAPIRDAAFQ